MILHEWFCAILLGILEGLTEFLPISSTGHLLLLQDALRLPKEDPLWEVFTVFIQMGAMLAVGWIYRDQLKAMLPSRKQQNQSQRLLGMLRIAFFPTAIVGFLSHSWIKAYLGSAQVIAIAMIAGGIAIFAIEKWKPLPQISQLESLSPLTAFYVGLGQCLALCPGVSRSGAIIMTGLALGLSRPAITEFSFLLALPTLCAATVYELIKNYSLLNVSMLSTLTLGTLAAFITAWAVIHWLLGYIRHHTFHGFAVYRILVGSLILFYFLK